MRNKCVGGAKQHAGAPTERPLGHHGAHETSSQCLSQRTQSSDGKTVASVVGCSDVIDLVGAMEEQLEQLKQQRCRRRQVGRFLPPMTKTVRTPDVDLSRVLADNQPAYGERISHQPIAYQAADQSADTSCRRAAKVAA